MNTKRILVRGLMLVMLLASAPAFAQATRTWVSGVGDDVNPCSRTAPCKTFAGAISKTALGGEISVLDPGAYGTLTITKAITIDGNGHQAGVLASTGVSGININTSINGNGPVILRNITIEVTAGASNGIRYISGSGVTVQNVVIRGFARGISMEGGAGVQGLLRVVDSQIENNTTGIWLQPAQPGSTVKAVLARVHVLNNGTGVRADPGATFSMSSSTVAGSTLVGLSAVAGGADVPASGYVMDTLISGNGIGAQAEQANATIALARCTVSGNGTGIASLSSGILRSFGNNQIVNNGIDGVPTTMGTPR